MHRAGAVIASLAQQMYITPRLKVVPDERTV